MEVVMPRFAAPAKINIGLRILGKRPDGYHAIETILQMLDLFDWLTLRVNDEGAIRLTCSTPTLPTDERNLVVLAAKSLQRTTHVQQGADLRLEKTIPIAAGLGGGSSNAAATLLALQYVWRLTCPPTTLHQIAAQLGSDVPFFLGGPTALAQGRGEVLSPIALSSPLTGVLVNPNFGIGAGWAYGQFNGRSQLTDRTMAVILRALREQDLIALGGVIANDLEPGVAAVYPVIREMKEALRAVGAQAIFMSGSGPTVCGLFASFAWAQEAITTLARRRAWTLIPFSTLLQSPHTELQG